MTTLWPEARAPLAKATSRSGVRWAETIRAMKGTPSAASVSAACRMVAQSDWLPMMMATGAPSAVSVCTVVLVPDRAPPPAGVSRCRSPEV